MRFALLRRPKAAATAVGVESFAAVFPTAAHVPQLLGQLLCETRVTGRRHAR